MRPKIIAESQYKGVSKVRVGGEDRWMLNIMISGIRYYSHYETEREAGMMYDKAMIRHGKKPCNILKPA